MVSSSASVMGGLALVVSLAGSSAGAQPDASTGDAGPDLTPQMVSATVASHRLEVKACYNRTLAERGVQEGTISVTWTIDTTGAPKDLRSTPSDGLDPLLVACVERTIAAWRFVRPRSAVDVTFPFVFQASGAPAAPRALTPAHLPVTTPARPPEGPAWQTARKWLAALGAYDVDTLAQLTRFPLTYKTYGMRRDCASSPRDAAGLKRWVACLRETKSLITDEIAHLDEPLGHDDTPPRQLVAAGKKLSGGEWVSLFLNGDGVSFEFRVLVTTGDEAPAVKALLVSASFDLG